MADLFIQEERGKAIALWAMCPLLGPVVGPVVGGFLSAGLGWRWVFWVLAIAVSLFLYSDLLAKRTLRSNLVGQYSHGRLFHLRPRDLLGSNFTTQDGPSPKGAEQSPFAIENGLWTLIQRRISASHHSAAQNAPILTHRRLSRHAFGCRLRLPLSGLHDHNQRLRNQLWLLAQYRWSHFHGGRPRHDDWCGGFWWPFGSYPCQESTSQQWRTEARVPTFHHDTLRSLHACWVLHLRMVSREACVLARSDPWDFIDWRRGHGLLCKFRSSSSSTVYFRVPASLALLTRMNILQCCVANCSTQHLPI